MADIKIAYENNDISKITDFQKRKRFEIWILCSKLPETKHHEC